MQFIMHPSKTVDQLLSLQRDNDVSFFIYVYILVYYEIISKITIRGVMSLYSMHYIFD